MKMKKTLAALLALTMAFGMASCGESSSTADNSTAESSVSESSAESSEESSEESTEESSDESKADESSEESKADDSSAADAPSGDMKMETFHSQHEPYAIKYDYAVPEIAQFPQYDKRTASWQEHYFGNPVMESYYYLKEDKSLYGLYVSLETMLYGKDNVKFGFEGSEKTLGTTANGYNYSYSNHEGKKKVEGGEKAEYRCMVTVYGESYRDSVLATQISVSTLETDMTAGEVTEIALAIADTIKYTDWDENALITEDGGFKIYPHKFILAPKATIAGQEVETKMINDMSYIEAYAEFNADDIHYIINSDILSSTKALWNSTENKADEWTKMTICGYEAYAQLASYGCNAEFRIKFGEDHVETVKINAKEYADGERTKDGVSFSDLQADMISEANSAATLNKMAEYVSDFVSAWTIDETIKEPK